MEASSGEDVTSTTLTSPALLSLLQLADSAFPTGMYAHSHGLEGMVSRGLIKTAAAVEEFLGAQLTNAVLPSDGVALLSAHGCPEDAIEIDHYLFAMKFPAELRAASTQTGRRLLAGTDGTSDYAPLQAYREAVTARRSPGNSAVALAMVTRALDIPAVAALLAACHSLLVSSLGAAMRLLPLTHSEAQSVLRRLQPEITRRLPELGATPWRDMTAFTPQLDLIAVGHEQDDLRMFAS